MGFNCFKATEPLRGDSLLFTTKVWSKFGFLYWKYPINFCTSKCIWETEGKKLKEWKNGTEIWQWSFTVNNNPCESLWTKLTRLMAQTALVPSLEPI